MLSEAHLTHADTHKSPYLAWCIPTYTLCAAHIHTAQGEEGYSKSIFSFPSALSKGTDLSCFLLALNMH